MPLAVDVLFPLPVAPFRYLVPFDLEPGPTGGRVAVPWQGGVRIGIVVGSEEIPSGKAADYREIVSWLDREPFIVRGATDLLLVLGRTSGAPAGVVLASLLPVGLRDDLVHEVTAVEGIGSLGLPTGEWVRAGQLGAAELDLYRRQGMVRERVRRPERTVVRLVPERSADEALAGSRQANQRTALDLLERLESVASAAELARDADVPESAVRAIVRKGYAAYRDMPAPAAELPSAVPSPVPLEPRGDGLPESPVVLVTGGLRRDRLAAILPALRHDLAEGRSPLVLAPETAFLAEAAALLASVLPVVTLSGEADDGQRERVWEEAASGRPFVLVGTYAALLAPLARPGRMVVTEAGSGSYKLPGGPRLFIPAAARRLAQANGVQLVLADALASPEMRVWANGPGPDCPADRGASAGGSVVALPNPRQRLHVSDLAQVTGWPLGTDLAMVLRQVRERGRQAVLLAPRRGFSAALSCQDCGHTFMCPNCDLALRYHRRHYRLRCHQCGYEAPLPLECPQCSGSDLSPGRAAGTEWVAGAVSQLLPGFPVARVDRDMQDDLSALRAGEPGVLVATTAAFRIPPLPRVSLLGITLLDTHLTVSDFRAAEESLRLLLQLPELAPGARPLVVVQTFHPEHEALLALLDPEPATALAAYEYRVLERRQRFRYPPFGQLAKIQVSARDRGNAEREAIRIAGTLRTLGAAEDEVLGPVPAPVSRVRGQYSFLVYVRGQEEERFHELLAGVSSAGGGVRVRMDVDPRDVAEFLE